MIRNPYEHNTYFPDEALDPDVYDVEPDEFNALDGESSVSGHGRFVAALRNEAKLVVDELESPEAKHLSVERESQLADMIQAGIAARRTRDTEGERYDGRFDDEIAIGDKAKHMLVTANLPFAAYCARASMGHIGKSSIRTPSTTGNYYGFESAPGTYKKLSRLARQRASIEDRTQVAIEAMLKAANNYKSGGAAKFTTYSAWVIMRAIEKHLPTEETGWDVSSSILNQYEEAQKDKLQYGVTTRIRHKADGEMVHNGLAPRQVFDGITSVPLESISDSAVEEADIFGDPTQLDISDITPTPSMSVADEAMRTSLIQELDLVLDWLDPRAAGVVALRYGLTSECPKTLDQVGAEYGLTRERIRQIESAAFSKLRHPKINARLMGFLASENPDDGHDSASKQLLPPLVRGAVNLRTTRTKVGPRLSSEPRARDPKAELWQTHHEELWDIDKAEV